MEPSWMNESLQINVQQSFSFSSHLTLLSSTDPSGAVRPEIVNKNGNPNYKYFYSNAEQGKNPVFVRSSSCEWWPAQDASLCSSERHEGGGGEAHRRRLQARSHWRRAVVERTPLPGCKGYSSSSWPRVQPFTPSGLRLADQTKSTFGCSGVPLVLCFFSFSLSFFPCCIYLLPEPAFISKVWVYIFQLFLLVFTKWSHDNLSVLIVELVTPAASSCCSSKDVVSFGLKVSSFTASRLSLIDYLPFSCFNIILCQKLLFPP